jgi:DNA-binding NarL/FixJ family response regulator
VKEKIGVLIVDDHRVLATGVAAALRAEPDLEVLGTASTVRDAVRLAAELRPRVALVDYHLPDGTGAEAAGRLRAELPELAVVMISGDMSDRAFVESVEAGAAAYLGKTEEIAGVADAIRRTAAGEVMLPAARLAEALRQTRASAARIREAERRLSSLTPREREVLTLLAEGLGSREIAEQLAVSVPTARGHVQVVLEKLGVHAREDAVRVAVEAGAIDRRRAPRG